MKVLLKCLLIIALTALFFSCTSRKNEKGFIEYEIKTVDKSLGDTTNAKKGFAKIKLVYPQITKSNNSAILDIMNVFIRDQILTALFEEGRFKQPEYLVEDFFKEYKKYYEELTGESGSWELERKIDIAFVNDRLVSFRFFEYSFLGGAHPNKNNFYTNYDLLTGGKLTPKEIFIEGYESKLTSIAEKKFREARNLKPDESLAEAGFKFINDKFTLNANFGFTKEGIIFFYNPYEVGPYALGSTEVIIPYKDLEGLIKKAYL